MPLAPSSEVFGEDDVDPLDHSYANDHRWHLLYPVGFFQRLADEAVSSLETWFIANAVDPYDAVKDSSNWYCD